MALYKGIEIPEELAGVIDHMRSLQQDREELALLSQQWDLLTILGQMMGSGTDMTRTREDFKVLTGKLLTALGKENLHNAVQSLTAKAQIAVDIVIRNLFERTADIGFLATDGDVRTFVDLAARTPLDSDEMRDQLARLRQRFEEYVAIYSVYENIILLDCDGKVLCQLDTSNRIAEGDPEIIKAALATPREYVESFSSTSLCPGHDKALLYSFRVRKANDGVGNPIGVLCLVFRFEDELEGVFRNLLHEQDWTVLTLLDNSGQVIATSDDCQVPLGSTQVLATGGNFRLTRFAGRLYLALTCATKGYQGFSGLGWYGHAMIPLEYAFNEQSAFHPVEPRVMHSILHEPKLFPEQLRMIPRDAEKIQAELDRTVWNGNLATNTRNGGQNAAYNKVLLWEISVTGNKTRNVFARSINTLHQTVVSSLLSDVSFVASLAIDIMDRNLYERANDCRWWALTTSFREILGKDQAHQADIEELHKILVYINNLYTVYTNLFVFDARGNILASSKPAAQSLAEKPLPDEFVRAILSLKSSRQYRVSPFAATGLYEGKPTYIYAAAIFGRENNGGAVGGIGVVFDSEPQLRQMLSDALPRAKDGAVPDGCFSVFINRERDVISSTKSQHGIGSKLDIPEQFCNLRNGEKLSSVIEQDGMYYAVGACCSKGYREYKGAGDEYKNDIIALTFLALGAARTYAMDATGVDASHYKTRLAHISSKEPSVEIATFYIGSAWLGVRTEQVQMAVAVEKITAVPAIHKSIRGITRINGELVYVIDAHGFMNAASSAPRNAACQVAILRTSFGAVGLIIDKLGDIPAVPLIRIMQDPLLMNEETQYIEGFVQPETREPTQPMLVVVRPDELLQCLLGGLPGTDIRKLLGSLPDK